MALMAARGSAGVGHMGYFGKERMNLFKDDATCGCLPKIKQSNKMTRTALLKERIRQFSIWYFEREDHREGEHVKRRIERKKKRKSTKRMKELRCIRRLFIIDAVLWVVGLTFTLCSTVETIGANTPFYDDREKFRIIGPFTILFAVLLLMTLTACERRVLKANRMHTPKKRYYILPSKMNKDGTVNDTSGKTSDSSETDDSGNVEDIEVGDVSNKGPFRDATNEDIGTSQDNTANAVNNVTLTNDGLQVLEIASAAYDRPDPLTVNFMETGARRKAWSKSKWMRMNISSESCDSIDDTIRTIEQLHSTRAAMLETKDSLEMYPILQSFSSDQKPVGTSGGLEHELKRDFSSKSKTSEVSNFSNFSETAPLVKR